MPGVGGGDEGDVLELEGAGVEEGEVVAAGCVGEAIADADRRVQGGDRAAEVEAAMDLEAAGVALGAGEVAALVEAQAGGADGRLTLEQVGVQEALPTRGAKPSSTPTSAAGTWSPRLG